MNSPARRLDSEPDRQPASEISFRLSLLDAQVLDVDDLPVGRIDDLELELGPHGVHVIAVLVGQRYLGPRLGGLTGQFLTWSAHRLTEDPDGGRISADLVASWTGMCRLRSRLADLPVAGLEKWLSTRVVRHIPGADNAGF